MLYKFKSRATAELIMLEANGRQVLEIIGKSPAEGSGIITVAQIPAAITALESAAHDDAQRRAQNSQKKDSDDGDEAVSPQEAVGLSQRIAPFLDMLRRSAAEGKDVTW